jgi:hypothetical protein
MIILRRPLGGARIASWFIDDLLLPGALLGLFKIQSNNEHKPGKKFSIVTSASYATWSCAFRGGNIERPSRRATGMIYAQAMAQQT